MVLAVGYRESRDVLWASDLLVLPSRKEGFGLTVIEAMLCGIVPVRTPSGGAGDQIEDGKNGFIVPFDDPVALADCIVRLLVDEGLRAEAGQAALVSAREKFTIARMVTDTVKVYDMVSGNEGAADKSG
jgi:glycosyltransferase involved in cell wall biosynthesis